MSDVIVFVRARLAEREEAALRALGVNAAAVARRHVEGRPPGGAHPLPAWRYSSGRITQPAPGEGDITDAVDLVAVTDVGVIRGAGAHIALNDPLAVLQLSHALREVLQIAEGTASAAATLADVAPGTREERQLHGAADATRRAVRHLARAWRDHPDYLPQWEIDL